MSCFYRPVGFLMAPIVILFCFTAVASADIYYCEDTMGVSIDRFDFEALNNDSDNFMFLDPPYDSEFTDYGYCTFGKEEQKKLAKCFKETDIKCLMIIGKTPFIEELYKDYIVDEYDKKYRFKLHSGRVGDEINTKHLIIKNY